jgi:histidinol-phosphate aminotransferase
MSSSNDALAGAQGAAGEARVHGGLDAAEARSHGVDPVSVLDLSVNLNPHGPCEAVLAAVREALLSSYPDPSGKRAREAWARCLDRAPESLAVGHGAAELMWAIARALITPGDRVVIAEPTFSELRVASQRLGARVERVFAEERAGFHVDLDALARAAQGARLVYLCSPNNPTGVCLDTHTLRDFARALGDALLVLDESFLSLSDQAAEAGRKLPRNVLGVRSLTKDFCLPGLRIGLLHGDSAQLRNIESVRPTWATSAPALAAIEQAAGQQSFVATSYARMAAERQRMARMLERAGLTALPSTSVFQLVRVGPAASFRASLLRAGVLVRDCSSFGLPQYVRIGVRLPADTDRLERALEQAGLSTRASACPPHHTW